VWVFIRMHTHVSIYMFMEERAIRYAAVCRPVDFDVYVRVNLYACMQL